MNTTTEGAQGSANSGTPLTDAKCRDYSGLLCSIGSVQFIPADFARRLERQLAQSEERVAKMEGALPELSRFIGVLRAHCDSPLRDAIRWDVLIERCDEQQKSIAALLSSSKTN